MYARSTKMQELGLFAVVGEGAWYTCSPNRGSPTANTYFLSAGNCSRCSGFLVTLINLI